MNAIPTSGFNERKASLNGMFGAGVYFAENSCKSDQYCGPIDSAGPFYMFLCRVAMGKLHIAETATPTAREAPEGFDSVVAVTSQTHPNASLDLYREFIVYDGAQVYPEFLVEFLRV